MVIVNNKLLSEFRSEGPCEWCGHWSERRQPHHIALRGLAGGNRLDVRLNLVSLGNAFDCTCHDDAHRGDIQRHDFLAIVAQREDCLQADIEALLRWVLDLPHPNKLSASELERAWMGLSGSRQRLALTIPEIRVLCFEKLCA